MANSSKGENNLLEFLNKNSKKILITLSIIVGVFLFLTVAGYIYYVKTAGTNNKNPIATYDHGNVYVDELNEYWFAETKSGTPESPSTSVDDYSKKPLTERVVSTHILEDEIKQQNITIDSNELLKQTKVKFPDYDKANASAQKAYQDYSKYDYYLDLLRNKKQTLLTGDFILCRYDRSTQSDYEGKSAEAQALKATLEPYAKTYCDEVYSRLKSGQSTYEDELARIKSDPKLGDQAWLPFNMEFGVAFDKDSFNPLGLVSSTNIYKTVTNGTFNKVGTYEPFVVETRDKEKVGYAVMQIRSVLNPSGKIYDFDSWIDTLIKSKNVKYYLDNIK